MLTRALLTVLVAASQLSAAAIAMIATPGFVVIAADGKAATGNAAECKIRRVGDAYYAPFHFTEHGASGYDLNRIIAGLTARSIPGLTAELKTKVEQPLRKALLASRAQSGESFAKQFPSREVAGVLFVGFENGDPAAAELRFFVDNLTADEIKVRVEEHSCPGPECHQGYAFAATPKNVQTRFAKENPRYWEGPLDQVAAKAEAFVNLAIAESPSEVGPPASVLVFRSPKGEWRKPGACKE